MRVSAGHPQPEPRPVHRPWGRYPQRCGRANYLDVIRVCRLVPEQHEALHPGGLGGGLRQNDGHRSSQTLPPSEAARIGDSTCVRRPGICQGG
jgi:hypothetical protein